MRYFLRRILLGIPTVLTVLTVIFVVARVLSGDPALAVLGESASAEALAALRRQLGLDRPLLVQYVDFIWGTLRGNFGTSLVSGAPVVATILNAFPYTLQLTFAGIAVGSLLGIPLGVMAAIRRNSALDYFLRTVSLAGLSVPAFYSALLLLLLFAVQFPLFRVIGDPSGLDFWGQARALVLPALNLGIIMAGFIARATRAAMLDVLGEEYVRTATAKGLRPAVVLFRHALRNALIPVVTIIGLYSGELMGSSVLTEVVFNRPGLGKLIVGAMNQRDYNLLQTLIALFAILIVLANLLTDLAYGLIDPRVRYE